MVEVVLTFGSPNENRPALTIKEARKDNLSPQGGAAIPKFIKNNSVEVQATKGIRIISAV